jgi:isorenieratene synthase
MLRQILDDVRAGHPVWRFGQVLDPVPPKLDGPDWRQADPRWIARALAASQALPTGGWYVVDASATIGREPRAYRMLGRDLVAFRDADGVVVGPDTCPHMGAPLSPGHCRDGKVVCPWHGLELGRRRRGSWAPLPTFDDGVLVWARFDEPGQAPTERPFLSERPPRPHLDAVMRLEAPCEPVDVVANRLDPWHGVHFHPHSFATLFVVDRSDTDIVVRVAYRVVGKLAVEVDARFHCPDPRTIVMTIVRGEGVGSVVETHATPVEPGRSVVLEATIARSERPGFLRTVDRIARYARPVMIARAERLWVEDGAYAARRYQLRLQGVGDDLPE